MTQIREIAFDTETTGLDWAGEDRIIELGAIELINHIPTGKSFRRYINPGRSVSEATIRITGITDADLKDKPAFSDPDIVDAFLAFVGDATLVAHNAQFDRGFLNAELERYRYSPILEPRWIDTVAMARLKFPGAPASLDALCRRFNISLESRTMHGALLDAQLLADVYLELLGGRARRFEFEEISQGVEAHRPAKARGQALPSLRTEEEAKAHAGFISQIGDQALWHKYTKTN